MKQLHVVGGPSWAWACGGLPPGAACHEAPHATARGSPASPTTATTRTQSNLSYTVYMHMLRMPQSNSRPVIRYARERLCFGLPQGILHDKVHNRTYRVTPHCGSHLRYCNIANSLSLVSPHLTVRLYCIVHGTIMVLYRVWGVPVVVQSRVRTGRQLHSHNNNKKNRQQAETTLTRSGQPERDVCISLDSHRARSHLCSLSPLSQSHICGSLWHKLDPQAQPHPTTAWTCGCARVSAEWGHLD